MAHATADAPAAMAAQAGRTTRLLGILVAVAGLVLIVAGAATWVTVRNQLAAENITVADDARWFAGDRVDGPLTAYSQADIIDHHAREASGGKTYAELDREDPVRAVMMNASFLRASLFTSVVSFGIAAMAMGLGVLFALIGWALMSVARPLTASAAPAAGLDPPPAP